MVSSCRSLFLTPFFCCYFLLTHVLWSAMGSPLAPVPSDCTCSSKDCLILSYVPAVSLNLSSFTSLHLCLPLCPFLLMSPYLLCLLTLAGTHSVFPTPIS